MPFSSKAQQGFMFSQHPKIAKKWAKETSNFKSLPKYAKKKVLKKTLKIRSLFSPFFCYFWMLTKHKTLLCFA